MQNFVGKDYEINNNIALVMAGFYKKLKYYLNVIKLKGITKCFIGDIIEKGIYLLYILNKKNLARSIMEKSNITGSITPLYIRESYRRIKQKEIDSTLKNYYY